MRRVYICVEELKLRYEDMPKEERLSLDELKNRCIEMILEATHAKRRQTVNKRCCRWRNSLSSEHSPTKYWSHPSSTKGSVGLDYFASRF